MQLGLRPRAPLRKRYKGFHLVRNYGRYFGIPAFLDPEDLLECGRLAAHPAVLSAATREELEALIDGCDAREHRPEPAGTCDGYDLFHHRGSIYGVPWAAGVVDLSIEEDRRRAGVVSGRTHEEVRERIRGVRAAVPVEFAGWLPVFVYWGNCGRHPQFTHTAEPPPGYRFTCSAPARKRHLSLWDRTAGRLLRGVGLVVKRLPVVRPLFNLFCGESRAPLRTRLRLFPIVLRLFFRLLRGGGKLLPVLRFIKSRHFLSQLLLADHRRLTFLTSMPYTFGQQPWVIEIEDPTTLFYPFIQNGQTSDLRIAECPYLPLVKTLLEADECRGIVTHMKSTAELIPTLFGSEKIARKICHTPLGVKLPARWQRHDGRDDADPIDLLFINSWCQAPGNFCLRGGLDILEAFAILRERYPQLRLTLRTNVPVLDPYYHRIIESNWVRVIDRFLSAEEMAALHAESHIFLLPAARVHIVSLLQAMSYGLAVVASDGWGFEEYVTHERNGLIVKGRYGKVSWADREAGILREDYEPMYTSDPQVVEGLVEAISRLVEDRDLRQRLGRTARRDVETTYNLERWNRGLKEVFDRAMSATPCR
jgi:glycosyltransferase involved in cell wall biosynthesis